jgi:hypothetical protein
LNFLLPAQTLLDLCAEEGNPAQAWARRVDTQALRVCVISIAQAQAAVMGIADAQVRMRMDADLSALLSQIEADTHPALAFEAGHAAVWKALIHAPALAGVGQNDRQVYATAMHEGLTVVEAWRAATVALQALGVDILVIA